MHKPLTFLTTAFAVTLSACSTVSQQQAAPVDEDRQILVVMTNHSEYPTREDTTGLWLTELTHFTDVVEEAGFTTVFASPDGGSIPLDERSMGWLYIDDRAKDLLASPVYSQKLESTFAMSNVNPADYAAIYFTGGHGVMWDFRNDANLKEVSEAIYQQGGVVSAVCHGVAALVDLEDEQGNPLIQGRKVTGFSNSEEFFSGLKNEVPFFLEDDLISKGADYNKTFIPFRPYAITDGRLITGQNPASAKKVAEHLVEKLNSIK